MAATPKGMLRADVHVVRSVLPEMPAALRREAHRLVGEAVDRGEVVAKMNAPVRTGFLRNNIMVDHRGNQGHLLSRANYSAYVNYGTRFMAARPYFDQGVAAMREHYLRGWQTIEPRLPRLQ